MVAHGAGCSRVLMGANSACLLLFARSCIMAIALTFEPEGHLALTVKEFAIFEVMVMH